MSATEKVANGEIRGRLAKLSNGRLVFVGHSPKRPGRVFCAFRNEEGEDKYLVFSAEAAEELGRLLTSEPHPDQALTDFPHQKVWTAIEGDAS